jgi:hypothetical protein
MAEYQPIARTGQFFSFHQSLAVTGQKNWGQDAQDSQDKESAPYDGRFFSPPTGSLITKNNFFGWRQPVFNLHPPPSAISSCLDE